MAGTLGAQLHALSTAAEVCEGRSGPEEKLSMKQAWEVAHAHCVALGAITEQQPPAHNKDRSDTTEPAPDAPNIDKLDQVVLALSEGASQQRHVIKLASKVTVRVGDSMAQLLQCTRSPNLVAGLYILEPLLGQSASSLPFSVGSSLVQVEEGRAAPKT